MKRLADTDEDVVRIPVLVVDVTVEVAFTVVLVHDERIVRPALYMQFTIHATAH